MTIHYGFLHKVDSALILACDGPHTDWTLRELLSSLWCRVRKPVTCLVCIAAEAEWGQGSTEAWQEPPEMP